ncbi:hypothetical protein GQ600_20662 [Phytophthora cactorum]|nr:hypothetical protein GQ600_20662 [Phytophthora cactorum]
MIGDFPSTVLESYVRFIPLSLGDTSSSKVGTDRFATVVAKTGEEEVNEMMQMLENMLLGNDRFINNGCCSSARETSKHSTWYMYITYFENINICKHADERAILMTSGTRFYLERPGLSSMYLSLVCLSD